MRKILLLLMVSFALTACGSSSGSAAAAQTESAAPGMEADALTAYKAEMSEAYDTMEKQTNFLIAFLGEEYDWQKHNKRADPGKTYPHAVAWAKTEYKDFVSMENIRAAVTDDFAKAKAADGYGGDAKVIYDAYRAAYHQFDILYELAVKPDPDNNAFGGYVGSVRLDAEKALSEMKKVRSEYMSE